MRVTFAKNLLSILGGQAYKYLALAGFPFAAYPGPAFSVWWPSKTGGWRLVNVSRNMPLASKFFPELVPHLVTFNLNSTS